MSILNIRTAKRRALGLTESCITYDASFNKHPLAACVYNYKDIIVMELSRVGGKAPDYLSILIWINIVADYINDYLDKNMVVGDKAAHFWLRVFLGYVDTVCVI